MIPLWILIIMGIALIAWSILTHKRCKFSKTCKYYNKTNALCNNDAIGKRACELYSIRELNKDGGKNENSNEMHE